MADPRAPSPPLSPAPDGASENAAASPSDRIRELEEAARRHRDQAGRATRELETVCHSISHDLRAPLRSIDGFSLALLEDYDQQLDEQGKRFLHYLRDSAQRLTRLIDALLTLSRVARSEFVPARVDLTTIARDICDALRSRVPDRVLEFRLQPDVVAHGDRVMLTTALERLLENAVKFTSKHPRATVEFGAREEGGETVYFVRDDGAGFDMAYAEKLFGIFQRLHTADEFDGLGAGLALVQRIVFRHGGRVWGEGRLDQGATFCFTLDDHAV